MPQRAIDCQIYRGGTSKAAFFRAADLPDDRLERDSLLLRALGSPDPRQIDGIGGAHPLTSKVAVIGPSSRADADVDYLFLQIFPDRPVVSDAQNCGNILAAVGPYAIENGLVPPAAGGVTPVRVHLVNSASVAVTHVRTENGQVVVEGDARIDGVPGSAAPIPIDFLDVAGSTCGALLPTGQGQDVINGVPVTLIDNGMPVILIRALDLGLTGTEAPAALEADKELSARIEAIRLLAGPMMRLGDVRDQSVPKITLLSPATNGGTVSTRTYIPHRVHEAIGVFGAISVATACVLPGTVAASLLPPTGPGTVDLDIEHPTGFLTVRMELAGQGPAMTVVRSGLLRTARRLMAGQVFVP